MIKNVMRYAKRLTADGTPMDSTEELQYVDRNQDKLQQIMHDISGDNYVKHYFKVEELSGGMKTPTSVTELQAQVQQGEIGGFSWLKRYMQICDTFFILMEHDDLEPYHKAEKKRGRVHKDDLADYVFLYDHQTRWHRKADTTITIENRSRQLTIEVKKEKEALQILLCLHAMKHNYCNFNQLNPHDFEKSKVYVHNSFSPVRMGMPVRWYVCGQEYMEAAAEAMENARERIFIADWQISPCVYLKRPWNKELNMHVPEDYWRLDNILKRKASQGVRIYILLYQDCSALSLGNYEASKYFRRFNRLEGEEHGNIFTLTHPDSEGPLNWAHHEKLVICDEEIAFVSGIDLSIGRWEIHGAYPLFDDGVEKTWKGNDYWNQFNVKPLCNLVNDEGVGWEHDRLDRNLETRCPWHDIGSSVIAGAASDVARHFIERWNSHIYHCFKSSVKLTTPGLRRFRIPAISESMAKQIIVPRQLMKCQPHLHNVFRSDLYHPTNVQIIRSSSTWSAGLGETECSILQTYMDLIASAERFIFIENQFFVTSTGSQQTGAENGIGGALARRIVKAHRNNERFKIYVVIPCVPGMNGRLEENNAQAQEVIIHLTLESINRGKSSILKYCQENGVDNWLNWISFCSYRKAEIRFGKPVHEIIYPHSKLMIVDDRHVIIGSSNINDRSTLGERDSEVAIHTEDMAGSCFALSLRRRIWSVALGCPEEALTMCPSEQQMFEYWKRIAYQNFAIYDEVFAVLPNDTVDAMPDAGGTIEAPTAAYAEWKNRYNVRPAVTHPEHANFRISQLSGTLVYHPLHFLSAETKIKSFRDLLSNPSIAMTKEGLAQWLNNKLFE